MVEKPDPLVETDAPTSASTTSPGYGGQRRYGEKVRRAAGTLLIATVAAGCAARRQDAVAAPLHIVRPKQPILCPGIPGVPSFDARELLGKRLRMAEKVAHSKGCTVRVVERDGRSSRVLLDDSTNRIDVAVEHGRLSKLVR